MKTLLQLAVVGISICFCSSYVAKRAFNCGDQSYMTTDHGTINSHGGFDVGHHYGKNMDCEWRIEAPQGMHVLLYSESFNVENDPACAYDYLVLFDGNMTGTNEIGRFCGNSFNPITSKGRFLTLEFITDDDTQLSGFKLHYNFTNQIISSCGSNEFKCRNDRCIKDIYICDNDDDCGDDSDELNCQGHTKTCAADEFTCNNNQCVPNDWLCDGDDDCNDNSDELPQNCQSPPGASSCGNLNQTGTSGTITSPNYPSHYNNNGHCVWYIQAPPGTKQIGFNFETPFHIEMDARCAYDSVSVYSSGHTFNHGPFCGSISPGQFTIPGDHAIVDFSSDDSDTQGGFRLDWKALGIPERSKPQKRFLVSCNNVLVYTQPGTISSENFPTERYSNGISCSWKIMASAGLRIRLHFNYFDVEASTSCVADSLSVYDGLDPSATLLNRLCGDILPYDIYSTANSMLIVFTTDSQNVATGFQLIYSAQPTVVTALPSTMLTTTSSSPNPIITTAITAQSTVGSGNTMTAVTGKITSPGYDGLNLYAPDLYRTWLISAPVGEVITLRFYDFWTEKISNCTYDYLAIYDGSSIHSKLLVRLCGLRFPDDITSTGNHMFLVFRSDPDIGGTGFSLQYTIHRKTEMCTQSLFQCHQKTCIYSTFVCNGLLNCPDGTDELLCGRNSLCGIPAVPPVLSSRKIVGGREARPHSWPWMISLRINGSHICGGAIIGNNWVITAAHCFEANRRPQDWTAVAGLHSEKVDTYTQILQVVSIIVKSDYVSLTSENDIALVKIENQFHFGDNVSSVCLPTIGPVVGDVCYVTGWGSVETTCCPGVLKQVALPLVDSRICNQPDYLAGQVKEGMICAGYDEGGKDACQGDSGGPLVCKSGSKFYIQGITSFGSGCAGVKSPGVYTKVFDFLPWVHQKLADYY